MTEQPTWMYSTSSNRLKYMPLNRKREEGVTRIESMKNEYIDEAEE